MYITRKEEGEEEEVGNKRTVLQNCKFQYYYPDKTMLISTTLAQHLYQTLIQIKSKRCSKLINRNIKNFGSGVFINKNILLFHFLKINSCIFIILNMHKNIGHAFVYIYIYILVYTCMVICYKSNGTRKLKPMSYYYYKLNVLMIQA